MSRLTPLPILALGLFAGAPLAAQDLHVGGQATLALPAGDLGNSDHMDGQLGFGVGAHLQVALRGGHAIVPRLDYTYMDKGCPDRSVQSLYLGADYTYYVSGEVNRGLYVGGGLGYAAARFKRDALFSSDDDTPGSPYAAAVAGYMFTPRLGAELRATYGSFEPRLFGAKETVDAPVLQASFIARF